MEGHSTLVVSTDPAHSLSDALDQDVGGGKPVRVSGTDLPLYGMQMDPEAARDEFRRLAAENDGQDLIDQAKALGLGGVAEGLKDLQLGQLLDNPPPGVDEAVSIARVVQFVDSDEYSHFTRIVFDTAPTGHTLRLLTLPDFLEVTIGKIAQLRGMILGAGGAIKEFFGGQREQDAQLERLEELRARLQSVRALFRDETQMEFVIATIATQMAVSESRRLLLALREEGVPCGHVVINQVLTDERQNKGVFLGMKHKDQAKALEMARRDPALQKLDLVEAPLFDLEVRGVGALQYFGDQVWR